MGSILGSAGSLAGQADSAGIRSPVGVWIYPGGGEEPARMVLRDDGQVRFEGSLADFDPSSWTLTRSDARLILALRIPALTPAELDAYAWRIEHGSTAWGPDSLDREANTIHYNLSESPCRLNISGWVFYRQSSTCPTRPGLNPYRPEPPRSGRDTVGAAPRVRMRETPDASWRRLRPRPIDGPARKHASHLRPIRLRRDTTAHPSPVGVWFYAGGGDMRMVFSSDGRLRFEGGFEYYNPACWEVTVSGSRAILAIHSPGFTSDVLRVFQRRTGRGLSISPDSVDVTAKTVYYDLSEAPCRIDFANWYFERRSEACLAGGGAGSAEMGDRPAGHRQDAAPSRLARPNEVREGGA